MPEAGEILERYYGYRFFKEGQQQVIDSIIAGRDTLGIMPTGGGKSICYQIPALLLPGTTIVISPLISLMKDQVDALQELGIPATFINSSLDGAEAERRLQQARHGSYRLLYIAPERLESQRFMGMLAALPISLIAVDEAHCVSHWGHDFRPSYLAIAPMIGRLRQRPAVAAFTATATPEVRDDIVRLLRLDCPEIYIAGFDRPNLSLAVVRGENKRDYLRRYVQAHRNQAGIVYAATRREVDRICASLQQQGLAAGRYHAGLSDRERAQNQEQFLYDDIRIMVASNAFGMGIDKSNVRYVIHYNMPRSIEAYYQEAGRAGRDGDPADCILLFSPQDVHIQKFLIEQSPITPERQAQEYHRLQLIVDYCHTPSCLRNYILDYFGEQTHGPCDRCGNCQDDRELVDATEEARQIFTCVLSLRERFGMTLVAAVLRGSTGKKVLQYGLNRLATYGALQAMKEKEIVDLINALIAEGYLALSEGQYPLLKLTEKAGLVLQGEERVQRRARAETPAAAPAAGLLFERLRALRKELSRQRQIPPYLVFHDSTLTEMCRLCPQDREAMLAIKGMGEHKFALYGELFLAEICRYLQERDQAGK